MRGYHHVEVKPKKHHNPNNAKLLSRLMEGPATKSELMQMGLLGYDSVARLNRMLERTAWKLMSCTRKTQNKFGVMRQRVYYLKRRSEKGGLPARAVIQSTFGCSI